MSQHVPDKYREENEKLKAEITQLTKERDQFKKDALKLGNIIGDCLALNHDDLTNLALKACIIVPGIEDFRTRNTVVNVKPLFIAETPWKDIIDITGMEPPWPKRIRVSTNPLVAYTLEDIIHPSIIWGPEDPSTVFDSKMNGCNHQYMTCNKCGKRWSKQEKRDSPAPGEKKGGGSP